MPRKFTKHSYQYIQDWLKNKYKTDPDFKHSQVMTSGICQLRKRLVSKIDIMTLEIMAEWYQTHIFLSR
jgi:tRNA splicing ligase